ncbi:MAG: glycosyltransferase [Gammaproteobacteria bacterium]
MKKKIIFVAPGNSSHSTKWISTIKNQNNFEIFWLSFYGQDEKIDDIEQHSFSKNIFGIIKSISIIKNNQDAIIHIHSVGFHSIFLVLAKLLGIKNKIISTPWGSDLIFGIKSIFKRKLLKFLFNNSDLVTCDALFIKNLVKDLNKQVNITIINFGVDTDKFLFFKRTFETEDKLKILSNRSLEDIYNIESIIKASEILHRKEINFELNIYAEGSLSQDLKDLVYKMKLSSKVKFKGRYTQDSLINILNENHIYISMARSDAGIASSTAEAMSTGMVCCVSDVAENNLWIKDKNNGFLIEDDNHNELANQIEEIYKKGFYLEEIAENARNKITDDNSIKGEMNKMSILYKNLGRAVE